MGRTVYVFLLIMVITTACGVIPPAPPPITPMATHEVVEPAVTATALPVTTRLDPAEWMTWPEIPVVGEHVREIYALGQSMGNDPQAFSIFGDCQSEPEIFLGSYIADPAQYASLPPGLQQTVDYFRDSLDRASPTSKGGTTSGALLWAQWHGNKFGCTAAETPVDCELRIHNPSFVLIMVGTHWEWTRNEYYMRKILDELLERGIVPILSTKADNREGDHSLNLQTAQLAAEYDIPLWNFWPVTDDLPNRGLYTKKAFPLQGDIYLTEEALARHRLSALQVLDIIRRGVGTGE